jgi:sulfite reductase (NADPH) flavoprotein alpha-component
MLASLKMKLVEEVMTSFSREELIWFNGYVAGVISAGGQVQVQAQETAPAKPSVNKITIAYGTETGNAKKLATDFAAKAKKSGISAKLVSLDQYRLTDLPKEEYFLTVISTQGEGEPPAGAKKFYDHIHNNSFNLGKLKYGVLALGDSSYPLFCKAGEDVDAQLGKLGGERIATLQKCDTDYETDAVTWFTQVLEGLNNQSSSAAITKAPAVKKSTGKKIYKGTLATNINLNDRGSNKETHHIEIVAEDLEYLPGDALGVIPENSAQLVEAILDVLDVEKTTSVSYKNEQASIGDLLKKKLNICYLPERVVNKYAGLVKQDIPATRIGLLELLRIYPLNDTIQLEELVEILEPIAPRLYSIASSPEAHAGEVHITVARDKFYVNDEAHFGLCSDYLSQLPAHTEFEFYIHKNNQFRLPQDDKDIIMIGPGTGIAPFRSFLAHRDATSASGRNWLFFGDQHFVTDFLYQTELQNWKDTGTLTNLNVAFSRDQKEKVYVQHKMLQHGHEFYEWLTSGAFVYICGAKDPMSFDVEEAILQIIRQHGNKTIEEASEFIAQLKEEGRFQKDVY